MVCQTNSMTEYLLNNPKTSHVFVFIYCSLCGTGSRLLTHSLNALVVYEVAIFKALVAHNR